MSGEYELGAQTRRAAVSVPANIAEGFGRWHSKEFIHFLLIANGSLKELETHFLTARRLDFFNSEQLNGPMALSQEIGRMLAALRKKLER